MQFAVRCNSSKLTSKRKEEQTERTSVASVATDVMTSPAADAEMAGTTEIRLPPGVTSYADDDERSLDENLRPMDGQIWLSDVDGGLSDAFQTTVSVTGVIFVDENEYSNHC